MVSFTVADIMVCRLVSFSFSIRVNQEKKRSKELEARAASVLETACFGCRNQRRGFRNTIVSRAAG